ncbi:MAG TPA: sigma-70 family RNA polymerase sigma factor [Planctomycetota bacterium]
MSDPSAPADLLQHAAFVRRLARSLLRDPHAAADVEQETWRASLERPPRSADPRGWLARVVRNFARRQRRADGRRSAREERVARPEAQPSAEAALERSETLQRVVDAVRALEEPYRATILARYYEDLAPRAIAARDGVPLDTVSTRLKRGLARLRAQLERRDGEWRDALGLLAGQSPCLPPHGAGPAALSLASLPVGVLAVLGAAGAVWLWSAVGQEEPRPAPAARAPARTADAPSVAATPLAGAAREEAPREPLVVPEVAGHVRDESGAPVPEARVHVLGATDPFGPDHPAPSIGWNAWRGRTFACDAEGRWRALLPQATRVLVVVETSEALVRVPGPSDERWVEAPAQDVDFVLRRLPTGTLEVRVLEGETRRALADFRVFVYGQREDLPGGGVQWTGGYHGRRSEDGLVRMVLGVPDGVRRLHVGLSEPDVRGLWTRLGLGAQEYPVQEVTLVPGGREEVVFVLPERGRVRGQVVDAHGAPLADAFVFFGARERVTGDEPFQVPDPARVLDGVRTGADGWFELRGEGREVSVVHAGHSGATVPVARAGRIVLAPRGALGGRLLDAQGAPVVGALLHLDGSAPGRRPAGSTSTDAAGAFRFESVEAGVHALWHGQGRGEGVLVACVRLAAGEEAEVELRLEPARTVQLEVQGLTGAPDELHGVLIGLDAVFGCHLVSQGRLAGPVLPGRYGLATSAGWIGPIDVPAGASRLALDLGPAELVLTSARPTSVQLVPADADAFLRLVAARAALRVLPGTPLTLRAAPGPYVLVGEAGAIQRALELPPDGLALSLE